MQARDLTVYAIDKNAIVIRSRSLPHWEQPNGIYFITFRTDDSVPSEVFRSYHEERERLAELYQRLCPEKRIDIERQVARLYCRVIDRTLHSGLGECPFNSADHASLMASALKFFDGQRYDLFAWCVMPNHVHVVMRCLGEHKLSKVLHSWKSYTATELNRARRKEGVFWQKEYFDHLIRSEHDLKRFCRYVKDNPRTSRLERWPWVWVAPEVEALG